ncbi:MAG: hypothetical protein LBF59_07420 [Prevotellaceae bacterium]|jgi:hypothetical protein|nr:hypothetical protein [Prevotellaceae bacterium]
MRNVISVKIADNTHRTGNNIASGVFRFENIEPAPPESLRKNMPIPNRLFCISKAKKGKNPSFKEIIK